MVSMFTVMAPPVMPMMAVMPVMAPSVVAVMTISVPMVTVTTEPMMPVMVMAMPVLAVTMPATASAESVMAMMSVSTAMAGELAMSATVMPVVAMMPVVTMSTAMAGELAMSATAMPVVAMMPVVSMSAAMPCELAMSATVVSLMAVMTMVPMMATELAVSAAMMPVFAVMTVLPVTMVPMTVSALTMLLMAGKTYSPIRPSAAIVMTVVGIGLLAVGSTGPCTAPVASTPTPGVTLSGVTLAARSVRTVSAAGPRRASRTAFGRPDDSLPSPLGGRRLESRLSSGAGSVSVGRVSIRGRPLTASVSARAAVPGTKARKAPRAVAARPIVFRLRGGAIGIGSRRGYGDAGPKRRSEERDRRDSPIHSKLAHVVLRLTTGVILIEVKRIPLR